MYTYVYEYLSLQQLSFYILFISHCWFTSIHQSQIRTQRVSMSQKRWPWVSLALNTQGGNYSEVTVADSQLAWSQYFWFASCSVLYMHDMKTVKWWLPDLSRLSWPASRKYPISNGKAQVSVMIYSWPYPVWEQETPGFRRVCRELLCLPGHVEESTERFSVSERRMETEGEDCITLEQQTQGSPTENVAFAYRYFQFLGIQSPSENGI